MIIWRGYGVAVLGVVVVLWFIGRSIFDGLFGRGYADFHPWVDGLMLVLMGALAGGVGYLLNRNLNRPVSWDSVFFIPILWLGPLLALIGIFVMIPK